MRIEDGSISILDLPSSRVETMGSGIFITGTDTGVGKTFFACGLAALLKEIRLQGRCDEARGDRLRSRRRQTRAARRGGAPRGFRLYGAIGNKSAPISSVSRWRPVSQPIEKEPESISIV